MVQEQTFEIGILSEEDLQAVDSLGSRYKNTIGFLTLETLRDYLQKKRVYGAKTISGDLVGYLLFADYPDRFRIGQLCVQDEFRGLGIARMLVDTLKKSTTTQKLIKLRCRRDFKEASNTWRALGFTPLDEKPGRSASGHPLTLWCFQLAHDDELGLWKAGASEDILDVTIDAHIFYDFDAEDDSNTLISKGLLNDFLVDSLNFWITDELFLEIDRQDDDNVRQQSLTRAQCMNRVAHDQRLADDFILLLRDILPYKRESDKSDVHHIAKTAASEVTTFITKDEKILRRAKEIKSATNVNVLHPVDLITSTHEVAEKQSYSPALVSGLSLRWERMKGEDCSSIDLGQFQNPKETKGSLLECLRVFLADPNNYNCQVLQSDGKAMAIRVTQIRDREVLRIPFARLAFKSETNLIGSFLIADTLAKAVTEGCVAVTVPKNGLPPFLVPILRKMEFIESPDEWIKPTLCHCGDRAPAELQVCSIFPDLSETLTALPNLDLDRLCAPLASEKSIPTFLVPIRPAFAMGLIDNEQAASDLFGGNSAVLLRWENVYYRKKSRHKMLQAPARILWYVSGEKKAIIGISHLDEVEVGTPKKLFGKYRKFGVLEWPELYEMCGQDITKEIMALKFSRTFMFRRVVELSTMREIFSETGISESLQSPSSIPFNTLKKIYKAGFSTQ